MEAYKKLAKKKGSNVQIPQATVIKKDYHVDIDIQSGMGFTEEGKRNTMMQILEYLTVLYEKGLLPQESLSIVLKRFLNTFQFGNTAEFMDSIEGNPSMGAMDEGQMLKMKSALLEALKDAGEVGQEASDKRVMENKVGFLEVLKELGIEMPQQENKEENKPPSRSISYKDLPPEGKAQLAAQAGIQINAQQIAQQEQEQKEMEQQAQEAKIQQMKRGGQKAKSAK
jgi:hypothetical protein